jgi:hypothetical protein
MSDFYIGWHYFLSTGEHDPACKTCRSHTKETELQMEKNCILDLDSPSYPPTLEEYQHCGCHSCLKHLETEKEVERYRQRETQRNLRFYKEGGD